MAGKSNDLNMLLRVQVLKLRVELDLNASIPRVKAQIDTLSKRLANDPIKLKAELDYKLQEVFSQRTELQTRLNKAPIKLAVELDMNGDVGESTGKSLQDFSQKSEKSLESLKQQAEKTKKAVSESTNIPASASAKNFNNIKQYTNALEDAERILRSKVPDGQGLFSSIQNKDSEGNLNSFIASLEKANGVVEKIRYEWDSEAGSFTPINRQTITTTQKHVDEAIGMLNSLQAEIRKLNDGNMKDGFWSQHGGLSEKADLGTITKSDVENLRALVREEKSLQEQAERTNRRYTEREKLILDVNKARDREIQRDRDVDTRPYDRLVKSIREGTSSVREQRLELDKMNASSQREATNQTKLQANTKKRMQVLQEIRRIERDTPVSDRDSRALIEETRLLAQRASQGKDWIAIQGRINELKNNNTSARDLRETNALRRKTIDLVEDIGRIERKTSSEIEADKKAILEVEQRSHKDLKNMYEERAEHLKRLRREEKRLKDESKKLDVTSGQIKGIRNAIDSDDSASLQRYIGEIYKGTVETINFSKATDSAGRTVDRMKVKMAGSGKTVKGYQVDLDRATDSLHQTSSGLEYNANRNLGVMEQLKIAMARVPTWMTAMTAFHGSIRAVRKMVGELLEVDKALTEIRRVASSDISIDRIFDGAVKMSTQLGNNIHDIMETLGDFARTFGDFNERQLLAITNTAVLMSNVSELSTQEAGETLISTMNAFNIEAEESIRIVNSMNEVDNNFAVSTRQLSEGMSKSASTAKTFGVEMEESLGHITAISSVTMESGKLIGKQIAV